MNFGINLNPILPLRTESKEQAEMCTQLLFGELFTIVETTNARVLVNNKDDNYQGWADRKMITPLTDLIIAENNAKTAEMELVYENIIGSIISC